MRSDGNPCFSSSAATRVEIACTTVARLSQPRAMRPTRPRLGAKSPASSSHQPEIFSTTGLPTTEPMRQVSAPMLWPMCTCHAS